MLHFDLESSCAVLFFVDFIIIMMTISIDDNPIRTGLGFKWLLNSSGPQY